MLDGNNSNKRKNGGGKMSEKLKTGEQIYQEAVDEWISLDKTSKAVSDFILTLGMIDENGISKLVIGAMNQAAKDNLNRIAGLLQEKQYRIKYLCAEFYGSEGTKEE